MSDERRRLVRPPTGGDPAGRGGAASAKLKTPRERTPSSQHWLERQLSDPFVAAAKAQGYRSRAAFKLTEIDDRFHLLRRGARVIDLGCAPGGWVQVAIERGAASVVGVDLLPVEALPPAHLIVGDFTEPAVGPALLDLLAGPPDVVLCDMAPNTVGHRETDHLRILGLIEAAAEFALAHLKPGGAFVTKTFQGGGSGELLASLKPHFGQVRHVKPKASRSESSEIYLVAVGRKLARAGG